MLPRLTSIPAVGAHGGVVDVDCPQGVVLISQTCDIVQARTRSLQVAPVIQLPPGRAGEARADLRPRYAHLPRLADDAFADLDVVATVDKDAVAAALPHVRGLPADDDAVRRFSRRVVRKSARFAFPDAASDALRPLEKVLGEKARRAKGPEGRCLEHVQQLRVEVAGSWSAAPWDITLLVVVAPGVLPVLVDDEAPLISRDLREWLDATRARPTRRADVAVRLLAPDTPEDQHFLWRALADAWVDTCEVPTLGNDPATPTVRSVLAEVVAEDELSVTRYLASEQLDLDHLSSPRTR